MSEHTDSQGAEPINSLRKIPFNAKSFEAGGFTYYVEEDISIERYKSFQKMEIELGFGYNFSTLMDKVKEAYDLLNSMKLADATVLIHGIMEGAIALSQKEPIALYVATLFINKADENRVEWSQALAKEKLKIWNEEGYDVSFFLVAALSRVGGYANQLKRISDQIRGAGKSPDPLMDSMFPFEED